jgi:excisionase family DNA binding protein
MQKNDKKIKIFSALEVANICGVVNQTAVNWIKNGHLKAFMTPGNQYRVYADDLVAFLSDRGMRLPEQLQPYLEKSQKTKTIIIVDDDENVNNVIKRFLIEKMSDFKILQAFDGFQAGSLISENKPAVIILDIKLPGINGNKLCRQIKSDSKLGDPIIIAITGIDEADSKEKIIADGADAFFHKPLNFGELVASVKELLKTE